MESFVVRFKNVLVLSLVILLQVVGLAIQVRRHSPNGPDAGGTRLIRSWVEAVVSPPERLVRATGSAIRGIWNNYFYLRNVRQQNYDLQAEIHRLRLEQAGLLEDARQGERLENLLAFKKKYIYQTVAAQVIGTSGTQQSHILMIDKGSADGIKPDMGVITPDGIVGKTRDVFAHTTQVLLINDQSSGAGVVMETTRIRGVLRGNADGQPQIINLLPDSRIQPGERILTSGGDQIFPRGLNVGTVDHITRDPDRPTFIDVVIRPNANLAQLEEVLVITVTGDTMTAQERKDLAQSQQEAIEAKLSASQVLSERLPSVRDPNAPPPTAAAAAAAAAEATTVLPPPRPAQAAHPDHYSPNSVPPARALTPGQPYAADRVYSKPAAAPAQHAPAQSARSAATAESGQLAPRPVARPSVGAGAASASGQLTPHAAPRPATAPGQADAAEASSSAAHPVTRTAPAAQGGVVPRATPTQAGGIPGQVGPRPAGAAVSGTVPVRRTVPAGEAGNPSQTVRTPAATAAGAPVRTTPNPAGGAPATHSATTPAAARTVPAPGTASPRTAGTPGSAVAQPRPPARPATANPAVGQGAAVAQHPAAAAAQPAGAPATTTTARPAAGARPATTPVPSQTTFLPGQSPADRARAAQAGHGASAPSSTSGASTSGASTSGASRPAATKPAATRPATTKPAGGAPGQKPFVYHDSYYVRPPANGTAGEAKPGAAKPPASATKPPAQKKPAQPAPQQ